MYKLHVSLEPPTFVILEVGKRVRSYDDWTTVSDSSFVAILVRNNDITLAAQHTLVVVLELVPREVVNNPVLCVVVKVVYVPSEPHVPMWSN